MNVNLNVQVFDLKGEPTQQQVQGKDGKPVLEDIYLNKACAELVVNCPEQTDTGIRRLQRNDLARKLYSDEGQIELSSEEILIIKSTVGKYAHPFVVATLKDVIGEEEFKK